MRGDRQFQDSRSAARRRVAAVLVDGLDSTGMRIAEQLIALGVGTVLLRDERPIGAGDRQFRSSHRGQLRAETACRTLRVAKSPSTVLEAPEHSKVRGLDLHLVIATGTSLWARLRAAEQNDSAVIPVEVSADGFCIGPMLGARAGLCCDCLRLPAADSVPTYGAVEEATSPPVGLSAEIAAALAVQQAQLLIEAASPPAVELGALFAEASTGRISHRTIRPHQECRCLTDVRSTQHPAARSVRQANQLPGRGSQTAGP